MKKIMLGLAAALLILVGSSMSFAAATANFKLVVIISSEALSISVGPYAEFGTYVQPGQDKVSTKDAGIRNIGFNNIDLSLSGSAQDPTPGAAPTLWTQNETDGQSLVGMSDTYRVYAIFGIPATEITTPYQLTDFTADDIITTTSQLATADKFAKTSDDLAVKGVDIPNGEFRNLWFRLVLTDTVSSAAANAGELDVYLTATASTH